MSDLIPIVDIDRPGRRLSASEREDAYYQAHGTPSAVFSHRMIDAIWCAPVAAWDAFSLSKNRRRAFLRRPARVATAPAE